MLDDEVSSETSGYTRKPTLVLECVPCTETSTPGAADIFMDLAVIPLVTGSRDMDISCIEACKRGLDTLVLLGDWRLYVGTSLDDVRSDTERADDAEREADGACRWSGMVFLAAGNEATGGVLIDALIAAVLELACFLKSRADA